MNERIHALSLSLNTKKNMCNIGESWISPFISKASLYSRKKDKYKFGSSVGESKSWFYCTMDIKEVFNSKLFASIDMRVIFKCKSTLLADA